MPRRAKVELSQGGGGLGSELVYAEVGDDVYGVEPVSAGEAPAPERYYPLAAGDTWVYEYYSDVIGSVVERREVLRDTTLKGDPYALLAVARYDPDTYALLDEALCAVRIDSGDIVWRAVEGECAVPEASFADAFWWVPLGWTQNVRADCDGTIGGTQYNFPFCFSIGFSPPPPGGGTSISIGFAVDVGLLRFIVVQGGQELADGWLRYARVGGVEYGEPVPVASEPPVGGQPALALESVYPNPFHTSAAVAFALPAPEAVTMTVFDALGRRVLVRGLGRLGAGPHTVELDGSALAPGAYVIRVTAGDEAVTRRVVRVE